MTSTRMTITNNEEAKVQYCLNNQIINSILDQFQLFGMKLLLYFFQIT